MSALPFIVFSWGLGFALGAALAELARRSSLRRTPTPVVIAAMVVSAAAAVVSHGHPTSVLAADVVARATVGAVFVLCASRARRWQLVVAATLVAVPMAVGAERASLAPWILAIGVATAGASVASYLHPKRMPAFAAVVGGLLAQGALRLPTSLPSRVPSAVAAAALLTLVLAGTTRLPRTVRRRLGYAGAAVAATAFVCGVAGTIALVNARAQVERGITSAKNGLVAARTGDTSAADRDFATARTALRSAGSRMETPMARLGLVVPVLAQHLSTIHDLTAVAVNVVDAAQKTASKADLQSMRAEGGRIDLTRMTALRPQVVEADRAIAAARTALTGAQGPWLVGPVTSRIRSLRTEVDSAARSTSDVRRILDAVPAMLGADGPRRYLLVTPTPAEARGSGGVIGNYGEITAVDGKFALVRFGRNSELNAQGVPRQQRTLDAPADFIAHWSPLGASRIWQNVNMSPDFAAAAQAMAGLYPQSGGRPVDGVISVDPIGLAAFLHVLGPVEVPSWPEAITADNAARVLMLDAYVVKGGGTQDRYALLADVAQTVWARLAAASLPSPAALADAVAPAVRGRHLQVWMRDANEERYLDSIGMAGTVPALQGDGFGAVVNNQVGNKIDFFLHRNIEYDATVDPSTGSVKAVATIRLRNDAPASGLPDYVIGNSLVTTKLPLATNRVYVSVYSPLRLTGATVNGQPLRIDSLVEVGRNVYNGWVLVASQAETVVEISMAGPIQQGTSGYRLDMFTQPLANPDTVKVTVRSTTGAIVAGEGLTARSDGSLTGGVPERSLQTFTAAYR